ncbi:ribosome biogenesis protein SLX9 homolog [Mya arenaria]|uniref:ribosome biogenesis protein SLX9 homolog n=1 Tax=Mya arenaria TaxID=6604 RepID=UPI0022E8DCAD|nr:ribosome biogenesis protein SLX9 homolog [Mya arenaria]
MGKVKRQRQKVHNAAVKVKQPESSKSKVPKSILKDLPAGLTHADVQKSSLFDSIDLSKYNITTKLPDFDARSTLSSKSLKGLSLKKKEKQKLRHELWIQKLSAIDAAKQKAKEKKRKEQTPVVGDIGALADALPTLDLLLKESAGTKSASNEPKKPKGIQKEKKRRKQMLADIAVFQKVISHPSFKENPTATISDHLQERHKQEEMDT